MKIKGKDEIDLRADMLYTRDIQARIDYLREMREELEKQAKTDLESAEDNWTTENGTVLAYSAEYGENEESEYQKLTDVENDLPRDETLIAEDYFQKYAQELTEDQHGRAIRDARWPFDCIDWEQAADELRADYSVIEIDGNTFLYRE